MENKPGGEWADGPREVFIVVIPAPTGAVTERFDTLEEARRRADAAPGALVFHELADGSERYVRDDGKPIQFHRTVAAERPGDADEPLPLAEEITPGEMKEVELRPPVPKDWGEEGSAG